MNLLGDSLYPWVKALHIIAVMSWMAGLLYLPRLFVYHAEAEPGGDRSETLKVMEYRLLRFIMLPAVIVVLITGGLMAPLWIQGGGWLHAKLVLVALMLGFHHSCGAWHKAFRRDGNKHTARFFRQMNEVPTVLMILIVILVVVKPF